MVSEIYKFKYRNWSKIEKRIIEYYVIKILMQTIQKACGILK